MVKEVPLQNGLSFIVDDEDYEKVSQYKWYYNERFQNIMTPMVIDGETYNMSVRRFILGNEIGTACTLFIDRNPFNCTRENIGVVNRAGVRRMAKGHKNTSSKYKGVSWNKKSSKWSAQLGVDGHTVNLGKFTDEDEAARAYNRAVKIYFGEQGYINKIGEDNSAKPYVKTMERDLLKRKSSNSTSKYKGVCFRKTRGRWLAYVTVEGKGTVIGSSKSEEEAAKIFDRRMYALYKDTSLLNFPELVKEYEEYLLNVNPEGLSTKPKKKTSEHTGVHKESATGRWVAKFNKDGKLKHIGRFATEIEAARAYDREHYKVYKDLSKLNFPDDIQNA